MRSDLVHIRLASMLDGSHDMMTHEADGVMCVLLCGLKQARAWC